VAALLDAWSDVAEPDQRLRSVHLAFDRPLHPSGCAVATSVAQRGRSVSRLEGSVVGDEGVVAQGFALATRDAGSTTPPSSQPSVVSPEDLPEAGDAKGRTAAFIAEHFEFRVATIDDGGVHQWVRFRHLDPDADGRLPAAALGLLADLASVGVFRTAARHLDGPHAVKTLDLALHLGGSPPGEWTSMTLATPQIVDGAAVASATLTDERGVALARVAEQVVVRPLS
jgi:acyl-CoA thioesterase